MATYTQVGSGGSYAAGTAVNTQRFAASSNMPSGGIYGGGSGIGGKYFPNINGSGGVYAAGAVIRTLLYDTFYSPPRPTIVFQVSLLNRTALNSYPQPDSLTNLARLKQAVKINIPGVGYGLMDGDQFTLYGANALKVKSGYASILTVLSQT